MFSSFLTLAVLASGALAQTFMINTPTSAVQCQPVLLSWQGGAPPYFLSVLPGGQPSAAALEDLGEQTGTSLTWTVDIAAGTSLGLTLRDSTGALAQSGQFTVQGSSDSSCIGKNSLSSSVAGSSTAASGSSTSGSAAGTSSAVSTTVSTPAATSSAVTTTAAATSAHSTSTAPSSAATSKASTPGSSAAAGTSSSAAAPTTSSSAAAPTNVAQFGAAAVLGAAVAAMLA
ncbi:hypothetical protein PUNSTDRAFT_107721 [Punctularia strigosozonata HHB-11173 SS5]|uniref:Uncharacterized protein n=1 Tax=Punctularia strigosozonata (strain HHB-11173) TaxID=741275 RepID=R7S394_PUNST|nr:uncharacterized protein PUNSTDRAFT_107721 [Punctularia strigosozonata HHB-11173 SS5]EIN04875.1 hypothetical protein PUNSTDRAFT_107721 [Punctularia strigosozonata HHB-11173 SS5]